MNYAATRRRFLAISAAACAVAPEGLKAAANPVETHWRGRALGAAASVRIAGLAPDAAAPVLTAVERELDRLEGIFSLYRPDSALSRLNVSGNLRSPPPELLELLSLCDVLHRRTGGSFDPTVQPLFAVLAKAHSDGRMPEANNLAAARAAIGWDAVSFGADRIALGRKGAALTLNGVAQGYITDRVADLLRWHGLRDILVDAGEIAALGQRPGGGPWTAGIAAPQGELLHRLILTDRALATSAPKGTVLDPEGRVGHIFDPARGTEARGASLVAVSAPRAALADALSTALCVLPVERRELVMSAFPEARIEIASPSTT